MRENSATLPSTVPGASVAYPPQAVPNMADEWQVDATGECPTYRCVWSTPFSEDPNIRVVGVQWPDGSLCTEGDDAPAVYMGHEPLPTTDARALAAALTAAADLADEWGNAASVCGFDWCTNTDVVGHTEHTWSDGVDGASITGKLRRAGVWNSIREDPGEPIMVGIEAAPDVADDGAEIWLSVDQATYLRDALSAAIDHARAAEAAVPSGQGARQ